MFCIDIYRSYYDEGDLMMKNKVLILTICIVFIVNSLTGCGQESEIVIEKSDTVDSVLQNSSDVYYFNDVLDFGDFFIYFTELAHDEDFTLEEHMVEYQLMEWNM
jgi:hypothetical protein